MAYAVNFVMELMNEISFSKPVMFQRDGALFIASKQGFGQISYGLYTYPPYQQKFRENMPEVPEILESTDIIRKNKETDGKKRNIITDGEEGYVKPIIFGPDDDSFSLEDILKAASALQKLPDDGKIRMISHHSTYRSHKYGYAADGIDVWLSEARVMKRDRYLELIMQKEDEMIKRIESLGTLSPRGSINNLCAQLEFPDCAIMTPNMLVTFPRKGKLSISAVFRRDVLGWDRSTGLVSKNGSIMSYNALSPSYKSPFNIYVTLNSQSFKAKTQNAIAQKSGELTQQVSTELNALQVSAALCQPFIEKLNELIMQHLPKK